MFLRYRIDKSGTDVHTYGQLKNIMPAAMAIAGAEAKKIQQTNGE